MAFTRFRTATVSSLLIWLLFCGGHGLAAPNVSGVSGTVNHGSSVTITGSGFGAKGGSDPNKPLIWADFETSINPTNLGVVTTWGATADIALSSAAPQYGLSGQKVQGNYASSSAHSLEVTRSFSRYIYTSVKRRWSGSEPTNQKTFRLWANQGGSWDIVQATNNGGFLFGQESCLGGNIYQDFPWSQNAWNMEEVLIDLGTVDGTPLGSNCNNGNGVFRYYRNGTQLQSSTMMTNGTTQGKTYGRLIMWDTYRTSGGDGNDSVYMDDMYLDDTWARVMIGNAATFAASTVREIQIPSAWADGSITVTVNRGSFTSLTSAFLYVIDKNGQVNAQGFPLLCPSPCPGPPVAPKNLKAQ